VRALRRFCLVNIGRYRIVREQSEGEADLTPLARAEAASRVIGAFIDQPVGGYIASSGTMNASEPSFWRLLHRPFLGRQVAPGLRLLDAIELMSTSAPRARNCLHLHFGRDAAKLEKLAAQRRALALSGSANHGGGRDRASW
jgi:hypothetical protein